MGQLDTHGAVPQNFGTQEDWTKVRLFLQPGQEPSNEDRAPILIFLEKYIRYLAEKQTKAANSKTVEEQADYIHEIVTESMLNIVERGLIIENIRPEGNRILEKMVVSFEVRKTIQRLEKLAPDSEGASHTSLRLQNLSAEHPLIDAFSHHNWILEEEFYKMYPKASREKKAFEFLQHTSAQIPATMIEALLQSNFHSLTKRRLVAIILHTSYNLTETADILGISHQRVRYIVGTNVPNKKDLIHVLRTGESPFRLPRYRSSSTQPNHPTGASQHLHSSDPPRFR